MIKIISKAKGHRKVAVKGGDCFEEETAAQT